MNLFFCAVMVMFTSGCNLNNQKITQEHKGKSIQAEQVPTSCKALLNAIQDGDLDNQVKLLEACTKSKDEGVMDFLLALLNRKDVDGSLKMDVIYAIGEMKDPKAAPALITLLQQDMEKRSGITGAIIPALGALKHKAAVPILLKALNWREDDWLFRNMAAHALGEIGDPAAVQDLINASYMADTREDAIQALARIGDKRSIPVFIEAINSEEDIETKTAAQNGLKSLGLAAIPAISTAIIDFPGEYPDTESRRLLVHVLGNIGTPEAKASLLKIGERTNDPIITKEAKKVLAELKPLQ